MSTDLPAEALWTLVSQQTARVSHQHVGVVACALSGPFSATVASGRESVRGNPLSSRSVLPIGSVTKTVTALALADAVVSGRLALDTPLVELIEETPTVTGGPQITLGHLASHTSGLPRLPRGLRRQALHHRDDPYRAFTRADLVAALQGARPHRPGARVRYSNFGAALLGEALSRHHQLPYGRMIADRVTGPLGLRDTTVDIGPERTDRAVGTHSARKKAVPAWHLGAMAGAGALWSTADDLGSYLRALLAPGSSAMPTALHLVQQPQAAANRWVRLGLGWHLSPLRGTTHTVIWHNGATAGSYSYVGFVPEARLGVAVLTNTGRSVDALGVRLLLALADATRV
jgi:serine-type D-Ala-D-Ala carboxypeptidase/endopeptidase